jgi:hypothetical protein
MMKIVCEKIYFKDGSFGWKIRAERKEDYKKLEEIRARVVQTHGDNYMNVDVMELRMSIQRHDDKGYFIIYKDDRAFDFRGDEADVSVEELEKFIDMLREAKKELDEKEVRVYEI